jgi:hypothetical protein
MNSILYISDAAAEGGFRPATVQEIMTGARTALAARMRKGRAMDCPRAAADYLMAHLVEREHEIFAILYLDLCVPHAYVEHCSVTAAAVRVWVPLLHITNASTYGGRPALPRVRRPPCATRCLFLLTTVAGMTIRPLPIP